MYQSEFPISNSGLVHLNHAGIAPWPRRTVRAIRDFSDENSRFGPLHYNEWATRIHELRKQCARLIGAASTDEIAFTKNTSDGLSMVAGGIHWRPRDNVVVANDEFQSNRIVWEGFARQYGMEVRRADFRATVPEDALTACVDKRTRLLATSSIQYATGYRMNLETLSEVCRHYRALLCVDAIQSLGAVPFDAQSCNADFVCADGHKWLLSPEGTGILFCRKEHIENLKLNQFGWHMVERIGDYERLSWKPAPTAARFECGSMNHLGLFALQASLSLLIEVGSDTIYRRITENTAYLIDNLDRNKYYFATPEAPEKRGGILTLRRKAGDEKALFRKLLHHKVLCAYRAGGVRLSPHFYTAQAELDRVLRYLNDW